MSQKTTKPWYKEQHCSLIFDHYCLNCEQWSGWCGSAICGKGEMINGTLTFCGACCFNRPCPTHRGKYPDWEKKYQVERDEREKKWASRLEWEKKIMDKKKKLLFLAEYQLRLNNLNDWKEKVAEWEKAVEELAEKKIMYNLITKKAQLENELKDFETKMRSDKSDKKKAILCSYGFFFPRRSSVIFNRSDTWFRITN